MDRPVIPLLFGRFDYIWHRLRTRLDGLTTDEYLWEPAADGWTVRPAGDRWVVDVSREDPDPAPITTIAWRMWHIASDCLASYVTPHLGEWPLPVRDREWFGEVGPALDAMDTAYTCFRERVTGLGEDGMWTKLGPAWGPFADDTWAALVVHAQDELAHHGAEIALLRDLYRAQHAATPLT
jgi:DinB family protein